MSLTRVSLCCVVLLAWASYAPVQSQETVNRPGRASLRGQSPDVAIQPQVAPPEYPQPIAPQEYPPAGPPQGYYPPQEGLPGYEPAPSYSGYVPIDPFGTRFSFRSDIGDGPGWNGGFQSFNGFVPIMFEPDRSLVFFNPRVMVTNQGDIAASIGTGVRFYSPEIDRVFGGSFWYDYDNTMSTNYDQWGISLESLGRYFDMRLNAYIPSNDAQTTLSSNLNGNIFFVGQNIGIGNTRVVENALRGGDLEIGGATPWLGDYGLRSYIGGYYFEAPGIETTVGVKWRTEVLVTEDIQLAIGASSDKLFGQNVYGAVTIYLPDGRPQRILSRQPVRERLYANVERNYRVNIFRNAVTETIKAINPATGLPYIVHHVDNNSAAGTGDGSVKRPFGTLSDAPPGADIVFVHHNATDLNGDPILAGYDTGITLLDNQRLLGQGTEHLFTELNLGVLTLPGNDGGPPPIITNTAGDVVTLANNNEVSGFQIGAPAPNDPAGNGIFGVGITDFNINRNTIQNAGLAGISLTDASGTGSITGNTINTNTLENIVISNTGVAPLTLNIEDNDVRASLAGIVVRGDASDISATILNNDVSNNSNNGLELLAANGGVFDATLTGNVANSNGGNGIQATADNGTLNLTMQDNSASLNTADGLNLATQNNGQINLVAGDNNFSSNLGNGFNLLADSGLVNLDVQFNTMNNNTGFGMSLLADNGGQINGIVANNSLQGNDAGGLNLALDNGGQSTVVFTDNVISGNNGFAMTFSALNGSMLNESLSNIQLQNNAGGIQIIAQNGSQVTFSLDSSDISNNTGIGFDASISDSQSDISLVGNVFDSNEDAGVNLSYTGNSLATQFIDSNTIQNTIDTDLVNPTLPNGIGLIVSLHGNGGLPQLSSTIQNNTIQNNTDGMLITLNDGTGNMLTNDINNNNILGNIGRGIWMQMSAQSQAVLNASNNTITTQSTTANPVAGQPPIVVNGLSGIELEVVADSTLTASISNNTIDGSSNGTDFSQGSGVLMNIRGDATLNATLTANIIRQNGVDGVHVGPDRQPGFFGDFHATQETSHINISLQGNLIEDNLDDGVSLYVSQVSQGNSGFTGDADFTLNGNTIRNNGGLINGLRIGAGVNAEVRSGQMDLVMTNNTITGNSADGVILRNSLGRAGDASILDIEFFTEDPESILNATLDGNSITSNGKNGVFVAYDDLDPFSTGSRTRQGTGGRGNITLANNVIDNNLDNGVFVLMNTQHDDGQDPGGWDRIFVFEEDVAPFTTNPGNLAELTFTAVGNTITNNGGGNPPDPLGAVAGDGLFILVGTGSYVRADIRDNTFSGNFLDDFHTDSYRAGPETPPSAYNSPNDTTTTVFLDRAARLDLRFTGNTGNSIGSVESASLSSRFISRIVNGVELGTIHSGFFSGLDADVDPPVVQQKPFQAGVIRTTDTFQVEDTPTPVGSVLNGTNFFTDPDSQFPRDNFINGGYIIVPIGSLFP